MIDNFGAFLKKSSLTATLWTGLSLLAAPAAFGDSLHFSLIPSNGDISGAPGSTVGWGYSITNQSSSDWLVTTNLTADPFLKGTPAALFDFPNLGPGETVTESFDGNTGVGLYELTWDAGAPAGFVNSGDFVLSAQWWNGDPIDGGTYIADAPDSSMGYSATISSAAIPEPSTWPALFVAFAGLIAGNKRRRHR